MPNTYAITIGGVAKQIHPGWSIAESVNGRSTFTCEVQSVNGTYRPAIGAEVIFTENGTRIFAGYINRPSEEGFSKGITTRIEATDYNVLADRRFVQDGGFPAGWTLKQALTSLIGYLTDYGVTLHASQVDGPVLPLLLYDVRSITSIFDELSVITGYVWNIDYNKQLRMTAVGDIAAPINITTASRYVEGDVTVLSEREGYANRIIVKAGSGTAEVTDTFTGNGVQTVFPLVYRLFSHRGYVTNAAVNETLDLSGMGATWTYDPVASTITRTSAPANLNAISITYIASFPYVATADAGAAPADLVERVYTATDVFDAVVAQALADGYLARALDVSKTVQYRTRRLGLSAGQTQTITISERNLSGTFLITDVQTDNPAGNIVVRTVTATGGSEYHGSWRDKLRQMGSGGGGSTAAGTVSIVTGGGVGGLGVAGNLAQWATSSTLTDATAVPAALLTGTVAAARMPQFVGGDVQTGGAGSVSLAIQNGVLFDSQVNALAAIAWSKISKSGSSLADLATRSAGALSSGNLDWARLPSGSGTWTGTPTISGVTTFTTHANPLTNYTSNLGALSTKYLTLHAAELWVETLVAQNTMATIGGRVLVAPTNLLTVDLAPGGTLIDVKYNNLTNGDRIYMEADGKVEFMAVTSNASGSPGAYFYSVTRNLDGTGANQWYAGDAVLNTGTTGDGFIDLYSVSGVLSGSGPTIVGNVRTGTTYNNIAPRWAIGNLNGLYGYATDVYGAAFGDASGANLVIDATNGLRFRATTTVMALMTSSVFRVGASGGNRLEWDGSELTVVSDTVNIDSTGITLTPAVASGYFATNAYSFSSSYSGTNEVGYQVSELTSPGYFRQSNLMNTSTMTGPSPTLGSAIFVSTGGNTASLSVGVDGTSSPLGFGTGRITLSATSLVFTGTITSLITVSAAGTNAFGPGGTGSTNATIDISGSSSSGRGAALSLSRNSVVQGYVSTESNLFGNTSNSIALYGTSADGTSVYAAHASGTIRFYSGGTTKRAQINTNGTQTWAPYGAGTATFDASGNITSVSDARFKDRVAPLPYGLREVLALRPVVHGYNAVSGLDRIALYGGFLAQQVETVMPLAVGKNPDGYLTLSDRPILGAVVHAIQNHEQRLLALEGKAA